MSMKVYEDMKDILCHELGEYAHKGNIDRDGLDDVFKLTTSIAKLEGLISGRYSSPEGRYDEGDSYAYRGDMRGSYDGMSNRMGYSRDYSTRTYPTVRVGRHSMDNHMDESYDDYSEARGRDAITGRYVSRDNYDPGYSRHTAEQKVTRKLEDMLDTTQDPHIREALTQAIVKLK